MFNNHGYFQWVHVYWFNLNYFCSMTAKRAGDDSVGGEFKKPRVEASDTCCVVIDIFINILL